LHNSFTDFLCFKIGSATRKIQKYYNSKYADYGITIAQSFILFSLLENNGSLIKELAERLNLDSSAITGLVDRLEKENLVKRQVDSEDRRAFRILLTEKGKKLAETVFPIAQDFNDKIISNLSKKERDMFISLLTKIEQLKV